MFSKRTTNRKGTTDEMNTDLLVVIDQNEIGRFDFEDCEKLANTLETDNREILLQGAGNVLDVLMNAVDQRVINTFVIQY